MSETTIILMFYKSLFIGFLSFFITSKIIAKDLPDFPNFERVSISFASSHAYLEIYDDVYISMDSAYISYSRFGRAQKVYFDLTSSEMLDLYKFFQQQSFDQIRSKAIKTDKRGGTSILLKVEDKLYQVANGAQQKVQQRYLSKYERLESKILNLVANKTKNQQFEVTLKLDMSVLDDNSTLELYDGRQKLKFNSEKDELQNKFTFKVFKGLNYFEAYLKDPHSKKISFQTQQHLYLDPKQNQIELKLVNEKELMFEILSKE